MNIKETIKQNIDYLSPQETKVAKFLIDNINSVNKLGLKNISKKLNIQEGVISKTLFKLGFGGFKNFKTLIEESYYFEKKNIMGEEIMKEFRNRLHEDIDKSLNLIDVKKIESIAELIIKEKPKIILFATGKTKIMVETFYFALIELGYHVEIASSLYVTKIFDVDYNLVFVFSLSGKNHRIHRYLNLIKNKKPLRVVGISTNEEFIGKELLTDHLHGKVNSFFYADNSRALPFLEKYSLFLILDFFLLQILNQTENLIE